MIKQPELDKYIYKNKESGELYKVTSLIVDNSKHRSHDAIRFSAESKAKGYSVGELGDFWKRFKEINERD